MSHTPTPALARAHADTIPAAWRRWPGLTPYDQAWQAMRDFTEQRTPDTPDALWLMEHPPVFTLGQAGDPAHVLAAGDVPVVQTDRGGQVTYHGPGQIIAYSLVDLRRAGLFVKSFVALLEQAVLDVLADVGVAGACRRPGAPGIYVPDPDGLPGDGSGLAKIAALGIKIRRGCAYHGVALNVAMDLTPFTQINPCGYPGLRTVDLRACGVEMDVDDAGAQLAASISAALAARAPA